LVFQRLNPKPYAFPPGYTKNACRSCLAVSKVKKRPELI
jgi:hypothetical protein